MVERINALDNKAPAAAQTALHQRVGGALAARHRRISRAMPASTADNPPSILDVVELYREPVEAQRATLLEDLSAIERERVAVRHKMLDRPRRAGGSGARSGALVAALTLSLDVADLARRTAWPISAASMLHWVVGAEFGLDALRDAATSRALDQHWDRLVVRRTARGFRRHADQARRGRRPRAWRAASDGADMASMTRSSARPGSLRWVTRPSARTRPMPNSARKASGPSPS